MLPPALAPLARLGQIALCGAQVVEQVAPGRAAGPVGADEHAAGLLSSSQGRGGRSRTLGEGSGLPRRGDERVGQAGHRPKQPSMLQARWAQRTANPSRPSARAALQGGVRRRPRGPQLPPRRVCTSSLRPRGHARHLTSLLLPSRHGRASPLISSLQSRWRAP